MGEIAEVGKELVDDGPVEAEAVIEIGADRVARPFTQQDPARVAGQEPADDEDQEDDPEENRDRDQQPPDDVTGHEPLDEPDAMRGRRRCGVAPAL